MTFRHGKYTGVFYNGADLSPYFREGSVSQQIDTAETSAFGSTHKTYVVGQIDSTMSASGMFDGDEGAVDETLIATLGAEADDVVTFAPDGAVVGRICYAGKVRSTQYDISSPVSDVVSVDLSCQMDGGAKYGTLLAARNAVSAAGNLASVDNAVLSSDGGEAVLHITENTRDGATVVKVEHSVDNSVFADLITFTSVGAGLTASEHKTVIGTVNRYVRANHAPAGSTGSVTYTLSFARL